MKFAIRLFLITALAIGSVACNRGNAPDQSVSANSERTDRSAEPQPNNTVQQPPAQRERQPVRETRAGLSGSLEASQPACRKQQSGQSDGGKSSRNPARDPPRPGPARRPRKPACRKLRGAPRPELCLAAQQ